MAVKQIQHAQFLYYIQNRFTSHTGEEQERLSRRIAMHGQVVDIPRDEDIARGEEIGAFVDEDAPQLGDSAAEDADAAAAADAAQPDLEASHDDLVNWIQEAKPNEDEMVSAAQDDPQMASDLMRAEDEASGNQPRKGVMTRLKAIAEREE